MSRYKRWLDVLVIVGALAVAPAVAAGAQNVYASGPLGAGGQWVNPTGSTYSAMNFNRMSIPAGTIVKVATCGPGANCTPVKQAFGFVQAARTEGTFGWAGGRQALCANSEPTTGGSAYCAWYD